jgi:hypothetical protein
MCSTCVNRREQEDGKDTERRDDAIALLRKRFLKSEQIGPKNLWRLNPRSGLVANIFIPTRKSSETVIDVNILLTPINTLKICY